MKQKNLIRSAIWLGLGSISHNLVIFSLIAYMAHVGPARLGIFYALLHLMTNITAATNSLLSTIYMKRFRKFAAKNNIQKITNTFSSSIAATAMYSFFAILLFLIATRLFFWQSQIERWFSLTTPLALAIPFLLFYLHISKILLLLGKLKQVILIQRIPTAALRLVLAVLVVSTFHAGLYGVIVSQALTITIAGLVSFFILKRLLPQLQFRKPLKKPKILPTRTGLHLAISSILIRSTDLIVVGIIFGFVFLGQYIAVLYFPRFIYSVPSSMFSMFYPAIATRKSQGKDITVATKMVTKWVIIITIILFYFVVQFADQIVSVLLGHRYTVPIFVIILFSFAFAAKALSSVGGKVLSCYKFHRENSAVSVLFVVVFIIFALLAKDAGIVAVAIAFFISALVEALARLTIAYARTKLLIFDTDTLKVILAGIFAFGVSFVLVNNRLLSYILFLVLLVVTLIITRTIRKRGLFSHL